MKKVFALVLALAMMMMATTAWAAEVTKDSAIESDGTYTANVAVSYSATAAVNITIGWTEPSFTFTWDGAKWTADEATKDLAFDVTNKGTSAKKVTITNTTDVSGISWLSNVAVTGSDSVEAPISQDKKNITYKLTSAEINTVSGIESTGSETLSFTVAIADPTTGA